MITQSFLDQFEVGLRKSFHRISRTGLPQRQDVPNYLKETRGRNDFLAEFMKTFHEQGHNIEFEIERGGHNNSQEILQNINKMVESKLNSNLFTSSKMDERTFNKIVFELKNEVRSAFYGANYLGKRI